MFSIAKNLLNVTKNSIFGEIKLKLERIISSLLNDLLYCFDNNKYIKAFLNFEKSIMNY